MIGTKISRYGRTNNLGKRSGIKLTSRFSLLQLTFHNSFRNFLLHVLVCLIFSPCINPQQVELPFEDIPIGEGIQTNVEYIYQDRIGYLWFATWSGLYRYDGYNFKSYTHSIDDTSSLFSNTLSTIYEDKKGILWIGSRFGLERFDSKSETFSHFTPNPIDTVDNRSNEVWAICEDENGVFWVGTANGLYKFDREIEKFNCLKHDSKDSGSISDDTFHAIYKDEKEVLWFTTDTGLDKLDYETGKFIHVLNFPSEWYRKLYRDRIYEILKDETGIFWICSSKGLIEFDPKVGTFSKYIYDKTPLNLITSIAQDSNPEILWIGSMRR